MDLVTLFTREESVGGLHIADDAIRFCLIKKDRIARRISVAALVEEKLENGIVENGILKNPQKLTEALRKIAAKLPEKIDYVVLSINHLNAFSKLFYFPNNVSSDKLREAMQFNVSFNIPVKIADVYIDWENIAAEKKNEILLISIPKETADSYVDAVSPVFKPVALETHVLSLSRVVDAGAGGPAMIVERGKGYTGLFILKNKMMKIAHFIDRALPENDIEKEVKKLSEFYEVESEPIAASMALSDILLSKTFMGIKQIKDNPGGWAAAVGAAMRGVLPRGDDTLISLMAVGTEESYEDQKRAIFIKLLSEMTTAVAGIIAVAFIAVWLIMIGINSSLSKNLGENLPVPTDAVATERKVEQFNKIVSSLGDAIRQSPNWSIALEEIRARVVSGIIITDISIPSPTATISMGGIAKQRSNITEFRNSLASSTMFIDVVSPLSNLEKRTDIPFSISFKLKDPNILYAK